MDVLGRLCGNECLNRRGSGEDSELLVFAGAYLRQIHW